MPSPNRNKYRPQKGQKVECIQTAGNLLKELYPKQEWPVPGEEYTVASSLHNNGNPSFSLKELNNPIPLPTEWFKRKTI